jgi:hypothetical protein
VIDCLPLLAEASTTSGQIRNAVPDVDALEDAIYRNLTDEYNRAGNRFTSSLGDQSTFRLEAKWKQKELRAQAKQMAQSLEKTVKKRREALAARTDLTPKQRAAEREKLTRYKVKQLNDLVRAEGEFQAQTDILAHSGLVDPEKSRVMYFTNVGPNTCDVCIGINAGNPYTIRQATTLGPKAHPNCVDGWEQEWSPDEDLIGNTRREVRNGERKLWNGSRQTPGSKSASKIQSSLKRASGGWRGVRREQKRAATAAARRR